MEAVPRLRSSSCCVRRLGTGNRGLASTPDGNRIHGWVLVDERCGSCLGSLRDLIEIHDREIVELDRRIQRQLRNDTGYRVIQQLNGVGPVHAGVFVAEVGPDDLFVRRFRSLCHLSPPFLGPLSLTLCPFPSWHRGTRSAAIAGVGNNCTYRAKRAALCWARCRTVERSVRLMFPVAVFALGMDYAKRTVFATP